MLNPIYLYFQYFLPLLALIIVAITVGLTAFYVYNKRLNLSVETLFQASLLGSVAIVSVYSLLKTGFQSINIIFVLLCLLLLLFRKKIHADYPFTASQTPIKIKYAFPLFLGLAGLSYTLFFVCLYDFSTNAFKPSFIDDYFYAAVARSMVDNGVENLTYALNYFEQGTGTNYYHYYELWLAGLVYDVFNLNAYLALRLVVLPFLIFNFFLGLIAITEHIFQQSMQIKLYLFGILAFGVIEFMSPIQDIPVIKYYRDEIIFGISPFKHCVVLIFTLAALLNLYQKQYAKALFWLLCLPILSFTTLPFIIGGCLLVFYGSLIFNFFKQEKNDFISILHSPLFYLPLHLVPVCIVLFYVLTQYKIVGGLELSTSFVPNNCGLFFKNLSIDVLKHSITPYFPFLILLTTLYKYDNKNLIANFKNIFIFTVCCGIAGALMAALNYQNLNAMQVLRMPMMPSIRLFFVFVAIYSLSKFSTISSIWYKTSVIFAGIITINNLLSLPQYAVIGDNTVDAQFKNETDTAFIRAATRDNGDMLITLRDTAEVKPPFWYLSWHTHRFTVLDAYERNTLCLNITDIDGIVNSNAHLPNRFFTDPNIFNFYSNLQLHNPFVRFMTVQKTENKFSSVAQSQIDFMRKHKVKRIMVSGSYQPPELLKPFIQKTITEKNNLYKMFLVDFQ